MAQLNLSEPKLNFDEVNAAKKAINDGWISTSGKEVIKFEKKISQTVKNKYCVALNSGTSAIHLSLTVAGVERGDEVLVQSLTFIATVNPILYLGANPIFFDVDNKFNMKIDNIIEFLKIKTVMKNNKCINKETKKKIKALIVTHLWGNSQNLTKLKKICKSKRIIIIEDAAEAFGTKLKIREKFLYAGCQADIGCFSFNGNKIITTGSGGALVTNNKKIFNLANHLANQAKEDSFHYIHDQIGYNYKLNNLLSSIGLSQIKKLKSFIKKKKKIHKYYVKTFNKFNDITVCEPNQGIVSNYWFTVITFKNFNTKLLIKLKNFCKKNNIEIRQVWKPAHTQKYLKNFQKFKLVNSEKLYNHSICLPSNLKLNTRNLNFISEKIKIFHKHYLSRKK